MNAGFNAVWLVVSVALVAFGLGTGTALVLLIVLS